MIFESNKILLDENDKSIFNISNKISIYENIKKICRFVIKKTK